MRNPEDAEEQKNVNSCRNSVAELLVKMKRLNE